MRYHFISLILIPLAFSGNSFSQQQKVYQPQLESVTIRSIHNAIQSHQLTCFDLVTKYIERIKKYNLSAKNHAPINAWSEINPSVIVQAQQLDASFKNTGQLLGPLHCIPIILKDNIDSFDTTTSSGSYALLGSQPIRDAFLVKKLRNAGAIILGKGGMDEFAWGIIGISSRSGRIGNAFDPNKNPGGSSGGPAAVVSASFALLGIGTDNSGSVRIPAAFHGLVGLRPSTGLISQQGIFPMGNLDGTAGPIARTTEELAILLDIIAKPDSHDPKTLDIPRVKTYTEFLKTNGLTKKRIGIVHHVNGINTFDKMPPHILKIVRNATQNMRKMGASLIDIDLPRFNNNRKNNQAGEIQDVNEYLASFPSTRKNFQDICESNRTRNFGTTKDCLHFIKNMASKSSKSYKRAQSIIAQNKIYVQKIMKKNNLDALLIPITTHGTATYDGMTVNTWRAPVSSNSGLPSININVGYSDDMHMPIGVELVGKQFHEGTLIEIAYAYEMHTPKKINPTMPEESSELLNLSIPELNNLFTLLGKNAYDKVLIHNKAGELTPEKFQEITVDTIEKMKLNLQ
ncbi:amidase [Legionella qingyii]|uniref:Amidase n=1 Tax=Legionella qingyii TaxID=2184757 RepID=A0A317TX54_9GAMM|nr:amidase [Legionella qingyii]PWY54023.1 amidase [Legionella qingyii]RUR19882.1 amidase [Legionella qingyii]RUR22354.1 amidase [Legionella qingyii]